MSQDQNVIFLSDVRLSFPNLAEPQKQINETTGAERISYNCEFIMPREHAGFAQFMQRYALLMQDTFKEHAQAVMQMIQNDRKTRCFGAGEEKVNKTTFVPYDGYPGNVFITAGSKNRPQMIQGDGSAVDPDNTMAYQQLARKLYGGCRVNAAVKPWVQKNKHGNGIRCDLIAVQFHRDDTPFGEGNVDASGLFGASAAAGQVPAPAAPWGAAPQMPSAPFGQPVVPPNNLPPGFGVPQMPSFMGNK